ncbi:MAG: DUF5331 domain-containing protein [Cyanobacteria bacterium P01_A01_bin.84]
MNIQHLRQNLKVKWLTYYKKNRRWLIRMRIWGTYDGFRRPSSGFILAAISALEPRLAEIFPFALDLNNNPDDIITALGLNFNPEEHLHLVKLNDSFNDSHHSEYDCENDQDANYAPSVPINPVDTTFADKEVEKLYQKQETYDSKSSYSIASAEDIRKELATWGASKKTTVEGMKQEKSSQQVTLPKPKDEKPKEKDIEQTDIKLKDIKLKERLSDISIEPVTEINTPINRPQIPGKLRNTKLVDDRFPEPKDIELGVNQVPSPTQIPTQIHSEGNPKEAIPLKSTTLKGLREAIADESTHQNQPTAESSQNSRVNKLVRWIDELCQGSGWEGDDVIVTPF